MPLPDRWDQYSPMGKVIPDTCFLAFKVPLKQHLLQELSEKDRFSPSILMDSLQEQGKKLGMIIDLTFTTKYYNRQDFENKEVSYKKIFVKGARSGQLVPEDSNFQEFVEAVKGFEKEDVVGVHCTHGVNRTGYFICRYMIEEMDFDPEDAVKSFGEARGHPIERDSYVTDLLKRKKGVSSVTVRPLSEQTSTSHLGHNSSTHTEKKPRWREERDQHPNWRHREPHQDSDRGQYSDHRQEHNGGYNPSSGSYDQGRYSEPQRGGYGQSWGDGMRWNTTSEDSNNSNNTGSDSRLTARDVRMFDDGRRDSGYNNRGREREWDDGRNGHRQSSDQSRNGYRDDGYSSLRGNARGGYRPRGGEPYSRGGPGTDNRRNRQDNSDSARYRNAGWTTGQDSIGQQKREY